MKMHHIKLETMENELFKTLETVKIEYRGVKLNVPEGFIYDGLSDPKWTWFLMGSSYDPQYMFPALIHDYLYTDHSVKRKEADDILLALLLENGVSVITSVLMYYAVRLFGGGHWKRKGKVKDASKS